HVVAADERTARRRRQKARDDAHRGRFAGAVWPQETEHFARLDPEAQIIDGAQPTILLRKALAVDHCRQQLAQREWTRARGAQFCIREYLVSTHECAREPLDRARARSIARSAAKARRLTAPQRDCRRRRRS